jgi:hypothetical protein
MKRALLLALLTLSCTEPQRLPADVGPVDSGRDSGTSDSGSEDASIEDASTGDTGVTPTGICENRPCLTSVGTIEEWAFVSGPARAASRCDLTQETLFILPINAGTAIEETIYIDAGLFENVYFFLQTHLSTQLANLDPDVFYDLFEAGGTREYWTGRIFRTEEGDFAFDLTLDFYFGQPPDAAALEQIRTQLMESFGFTLKYAPQSLGAISMAEQFQNPPFEVLLPVPCAGEGCSDPNAFCAVIPQGTELCGHFAEGRDVPGELDAKIRLQVAPGSYEIPRQVGTMPMHLFTGGTYGIDRIPIDASAEGLLTVRDFGGGSLSYSYAQTLTAGADTIELTWELGDFVYREPRLTQAGAYGIVNNSQMFPDGQIIAGSCTASDLHLYFAEGQLANGDSFRFSYRHQIPFAGSGPLFLTGAQVTLGGGMAIVRDYFQLTYAGEHHNWNNQFLILFDQPLTYLGHDVYGIWIDEPGFQCCPVDSIYTVDQNHQKLDQLEVLGYLRAPAF